MAMLNYQRVTPKCKCSNTRTSSSTSHAWHSHAAVLPTRKAGQRRSFVMFHVSKSLGMTIQVPLFTWCFEQTKIGGVSIVMGVPQFMDA